MNFKHRYHLFIFFFFFLLLPRRKQHGGCLDVVFMNFKVYTRIFIYEKYTHSGLQSRLIHISPRCHLALKRVMTEGYIVREKIWDIQLFTRFCAYPPPITPHLWWRFQLRSNSIYVQWVKQTVLLNLKTDLRSFHFFFQCFLDRRLPIIKTKTE